jgi:hypothetical protein
MPIRTPEENTRDKIRQIIKEVLKKDYIELSPKQVTAAEIFAEDQTVVYCEFLERAEGKERSLKMERRGHGAIDAIWQMLVEHYSKKYKSLETLSFKGLDIDTQSGIRKSKGSGSDAEVSVGLRLTNPDKKEVTFRSGSRSILASSVTAAFSAAEFYINSELTFRKLRNLIKNSTKRNRGDLTAMYVYKLSEVVSVTSYDKITKDERLED